LHYLKKPLIGVFLDPLLKVSLYIAQPKAAKTVDVINLRGGTIGLLVSNLSCLPKPVILRRFSTIHEWCNQQL